MWSLLLQEAWRGHNVSLPTLNIVETLFLQPGNALVGALEQRPCEHVIDVHSPAVVMPSANTATLREHWQRWSILSAAGVGEHISGDRSALADVVEKVPDKTMIIVHDNLSVN